MTTCAATYDTANFVERRKRSGKPAKAGVLRPLLAPSQRAIYCASFTVWGLALAAFWIWWTQPGHNIGAGRFLLNSIVLGWFTLMPAYLLVVFHMGSFADRRRKLAQGMRVAMVVTKAPSEPFPVVRRTLESMLSQSYPHDTWLADEDPSEETLTWCKTHGVKVSSRKGASEYHRATWPRRTRCKEGNLAYFYDHFGYEAYDFVSQLDADHVPEPGYLEEMLRPFADPRVGYVSAPSICDENASKSWAARGRLHVEGPVHGALQAGYTGGMAPVCIGSHYAVRTKALKEIGGLGPELAEDHSTTLMMNAAGWRGVHALHAIAHGDGPATFADMITQEFQWSRSLITLLLQHTPRYLGRLPLRLKFQFLFCQLWYPVFAIFMALMYALPLLALFSHQNMLKITYVDFFVRFSMIVVSLLVILYWWRRQGWLRPNTAKVMSWEGALYLFARWPWWVIGTVAAVRDTITGTVADFRVTPKGSDVRRSLPLRALLPYLLLSAGSSIPALLLHDVGEARGFYVYATLNSVLYALLALTAVVMHWRENPVLQAAPRRPILSLQSLKVGFIGAVCLIAFVSVPLRAPLGIASFTYDHQSFFRSTPLQLSEFVLPYASSSANGRKTGTSTKGE